MTNVCPHCGKDDQIRKVSAIVSEGSASAEYSDLLGTIGGTGSVLHQTLLAKKLMPPKFFGGEEPHEFTSMRGICLFTFIAVFVGLILLSKGFTGTIGIGWAGVALILAGLWAFFQTLYSIKSGKERRIYKDKMADYLRMKANYESSRQRWNSAYYCGRCDGIFIQGSSEFMPIERFDEFLHMGDR